MLPVLHTRRLILRPWTPQDVDALHGLFTAPEVRRYLWDDVIITRNLVRQLVDSHAVTSDRHGIGKGVTGWRRIAAHGIAAESGCALMAVFFRIREAPSFR